MGEFSKPTGSRLISFISVITVLVAFLFYLISFGSPHWARTKPDGLVLKREEHFGVWRYCTYPQNGDQTCGDFIDVRYSDWLRAVQSFETLALFTFLGAVAATLVLAVLKDENATKIMGAAMGCLGATIAFLLIGVAVFSARYSEYFINKEGKSYDKDDCELWWAFGLNCCSLILCAVTMVLIVLSGIQQRNDY